MGSRKDESIVHELARLERRFRRNDYDGSPSGDHLIVPGSVPVMISAPHSVNHVREGVSKPAELMTGALALWLGKRTGCHVIVRTSNAGGDPNYDSPESNGYQRDLLSYLASSGVCVLIDLHGASSDRDFAVDIGTSPTDECPQGRSLHGHTFVTSFLRYSFEYAFARNDLPKRRVSVNEVFSASRSTTVTGAISSASDVACVQLEVNGTLRSAENPGALLALARTLESVVRALSLVEWKSSRVEAYRLCKGDVHKPQDIVKLCLERDDEPPFPDFSYLFISSSNATGEGVRLHYDAPSVKACARGEVGESCDASEYILLTNRMIQRLYGRGWIEPDEDAPGLLGAPVLVLMPVNSSFKIGVPLVDKIDKVRLSSSLCARVRLAEGGEHFSYAVYNRYTDSALPIDVAAADYGDHGRVSGEKVMIPHYYRKLLGMGELPLRQVRREEYELLLREAAPQDQRVLERCYEEVSSNAFVVLRSPDQTCEQDLARVAKIQRDAGFDSSIILMRKRTLAPKTGNAITRFLRRVSDAVLGLYVGSSSFDLRTTWTTPHDDSGGVARLSPLMMEMLGVQSNDVLVVRFAARSVNLRVLASDNLEDFQIGIPAPARAQLDLNSVNDVVRVSRNMVHIIARHSEGQLLAILGTVLAVFQVIPDPAWGLLTSVVLTPFMLYVVLNEERVKVK